MKETITYLIISIFLVCSTHVWSAIKSGCFYGKGTKNNPLKKYIDNLHRVQTPFWYSLFGALFFMSLAIFRLIQGTEFEKAVEDYGYFRAVLAAFLVIQGASAFCGVFYQGFVNIGSKKPFIDPKELDKFELANPFGEGSVWFPKFWYGKNRVWVSIVGLTSIVLGIWLML